MFNKIVKHYWIVLIFIISITYGQMFSMGVWKDDNAIFFKLEHIQESAGFFGKGIIGEGPYRFSFTPYWFLYKLFGNTNTFPYYLLIFIFYFICAIVIYKLFSKFISPKAGKVAAFLFACGYIASEGFFWLANAMISDVAIILISLILLSYYLYARKKKLIYYFLAVVLYLMTAIFVPVRTHYVFGIIIVFELIFLGLSKKIKPVLISLLRLIPFFVIFNAYFLANADARSGLIKDFFNKLISGKLYVTYGFFSSLANLVIPDLGSSKFLSRSYAPLTIIFLSIIFFYFIFTKKKHRKLWSLTLSTIVTVWYLLSNSIFSDKSLNLNDPALLLPFVGGLIVICVLTIFIIIKKEDKRKFSFLVISLFISIGAYSAYEPAIAMEAIHRYLTNSFFLLVGIFALLYINLDKSKKLSAKLAKYLIILWGMGNFLNSITYQNNILQTRSYPVSIFYKDLKSSISKINKGDVFYFDIATDNNARNYFGSAISTASMPNETSFAWRYNVDRYDLHIVDNLEDFLEITRKESTPSQNIHTFFYTGTNLINTTKSSLKYLDSPNNFENKEFTVKETLDGLELNFVKPVESITPIEVKLTSIAALPDSTKIKFPYQPGSNIVPTNSIITNNTLREEAYLYQKEKKEIISNSKITTSSDWQKNISSNLKDTNKETNWQSDRILWSTEPAIATLDLGKTREISKFIWINGYPNSTPTKYQIDYSLDAKKWTNLKTITNSQRLTPDSIETVDFEPTTARFFRMIINESLDGDSPKIAEIWAVSDTFTNLDIKETEEFLQDPFAYVPDKDSFQSTLTSLNNVGLSNVSWLGNKKNNWDSNFDSKIKVIYDNKIHEYNFTIPQSGTMISKIKLNQEIPGEMNIKNIAIKHLSLKELTNEKK